MPTTSPLYLSWQKDKNFKYRFDGVVNYKPSNNEIYLRLKKAVIRPNYQEEGTNEKRVLLSSLLNFLFLKIKLLVIIYCMGFFFSLCQ